MSGLIPLLLPSSAGSRSSVGLTLTEPGRRASLALSPSPTPSPSLVHRRQQSLPSLRQLTRGSFTPPAALSIVPFTSVEWKNAIDEVKRKYLNRKYRACSTRCCEVLDNLRDPSAVEPLYLIYLHFYAASSFELCARPLSCSSNYRTRLLRDAQAHYQKAEVLIQGTEENMTHRTRSGSSSSTVSSLHSPGLSTSSTTLSSPRTSVCSAEDGVVSKASPKPVVKAKKKVSFSGLNDLIEFQPEPYIRPDSPTLGWEDDIFPQHLEDSFPLFPAEKNKSERLSKTESAISLKTPPESPLDIAKFPMPGDHLLTDLPSPTDDKFNLDTFLQTRSMNKIAAQLSALRLQVSWHRDGVEALLTVPDDAPATPTVATDMSSALPKLLTPPRLNRASTLPTELDSESPSSEKTMPWSAPGLRDSFVFDNPRTISRPASAASTIRCSDEALQQRIERLRASGWRRKRFDSRRYEALREQVLGELGV
ncbi:hypothetical protein F4820DRAFT_104097 [Hypoxylon rubiginosum]|uniref:Uncharacterized protein n=1 Tax=Hypoxylon rubiginosum TaxID=110542 RepID=A0ACB9ZBG6_9PEZI|nr:hypothetical protein F4820DRAFT_104097 [Hypoxylon rubiginosum]